MNEEDLKSFYQALATQKQQHKDIMRVADDLKSLRHNYQQTIDALPDKIEITIEKSLRAQQPVVENLITKGNARIHERLDKVELTQRTFEQTLYGQNGHGGLIEKVEKISATTSPLSAILKLLPILITVIGGLVAIKIGLE